MLILLTAVFACLHLTEQGAEQAGVILIDGKETPISSLPFEQVSGTVADAKGEETRIDTVGVPLSKLFDCDVRVKASDSYSAAVPEDELGDAFLVQEGDSVRLVVFGDTDLRRNVRNVTEVCTG